MIELQTEHNMKTITSKYHRYFASQILIKMTKGTFPKTIESAKYDFIRDKAQKETIELLAKTLIEVRKHMTAHIPENVFDMVDDALTKSGFTA